VALAPVPAGAPTRAAWERAYLLPAEASLVGSRAVEKRRAEFVAGRLAAKAAAGLLLGRPWDRAGIAVLREGGATTGAPRLWLSGESACDIRASVSHADGIAVAAASREAVGIDLVAIEHHGPAFEADAFASGELHAWRSWLGDVAGSHETVAIAFAAKEAALKWMGTGLTIPLHQVSVLPVGVRAPAPAFRDGSGGLRVLKVNPGGGDAFVTVPQATLRVSIDETRRRTSSVLSARILELEDRVVFLLWGPDGSRLRA
jgi:phosphopantetheinyl transferase (holo-ACP synthase)